MWSTTPADLWTWSPPTTTPSSGTGLDVTPVATVPAPTQRLRHALEGPAAPSRHMTVVSSATGPLPDLESLGHGLSSNKVSSPQRDKGKDAMETDDVNAVCCL